MFDKTKHAGFTIHTMPKLAFFERHGLAQSFGMAYLDKIKHDIGVILAWFLKIYTDPLQISKNLL